MAQSLIHKHFTLSWLKTEINIPLYWISSNMSNCSLTIPKTENCSEKCIFLLPNWLRGRHTNSYPTGHTRISHYIVSLNFFDFANLTTIGILLDIIWIIFFINDKIVSYYLHLFLNLILNIFIDILAICSSFTSWLYMSFFLFISGATQFLIIDP